MTSFMDEPVVDQFYSYSDPIICYLSDAEQDDIGKSKTICK